ncbi:response regulator transcription factor [Modestobacter sp. SYSU DS0511]
MTFEESLRAVASGGPLARLRGAVELLCAETNLDVAQVNSIDPRSGEHIELANLGHEERVARYYTSTRFTTRCMGFRRQRRNPEELFSWEDIPGFRESHTAREVLSPSGFGNGMSALVTNRRGAVVGVCNVNSVAEVIAPRTKQVFLGLRPTLAGLIEEAERYRSLGLSPRELEVLRLLATGLSNREIAEQLVVATRTVSTHVEHLLGKLGVSSRVQAATLAVRAGLLPEA